MAYLKAEFLVTVERQEAALGVLTALGMLGSEEEAAGQVDVRMRACFTGDTDPREVETALRTAGVAGTISLEVVEDQDWNAAWQRSIQPVELVPGVWVSPSWRPPPGGRGDAWIRIEPRMAFGTGHHESTRLAAQGIRAAADLIEHRRSLLDVGAGSGVLCFYGALVGFAECIGVEIDTPCRESMAANLRDNPCGGRVQLVIGEESCLRSGLRFDCIAMNMIFPDAVPLLERLTRRLSPKGALVWSGILLESRQEACNAAAKAALAPAREFTEHEWWAGVFTLSGHAGVRCNSGRIRA